MADFESLVRARDELYESPWFDRNNVGQSAIGQLADGGHPDWSDPVVLTLTKQQAAKLVIASTASAAYSASDGRLKIATESLEMARVVGDQAFPATLQAV